MKWYNSKKAHEELSKKINTVNNVAVPGPSLNRKASVQSPASMLASDHILAQRLQREEIARSKAARKVLKKKGKPQPPIPAGTPPGNVKMATELQSDSSGWTDAKGKTKLTWKAPRAAKPVSPTPATPTGFECFTKNLGSSKRASKRLKVAPKKFK